MKIEWNPFQPSLPGSFLLVAAFVGLVFSVAADDVTNQFMIGNESVKSTAVGGKIVGDRLMAISNKLYLVHAEVAPVEHSSVNSKTPATEESGSEPCLRLLMSTAPGPAHFGRIKGLHGLMYLAFDWRTPASASTNRVDILSSEDSTRIVVMVADNGPIYSSTNSGMTWTAVNAPGSYEFRLSGDESGNAFIAAGTIRPFPQNQPPPRLMLMNWYAIGSAADGSKMVLMENVAQAAPALKITRSDSGAVVSWPSAFTRFFLQADDDLSSTNWTDVPSPVKTVGDENQVYVPDPITNTFFRLRSK